MPRKQLTIAKREVTQNEDPLILEINGEDFVCQSEISGFVLMELAAAGAEDAKPTDASVAFIAFYKDVLEPESYVRFRTMVIANKWNADDLLPFVQMAVEEISARPTLPPSSSPPGEEPTSTASRVISLDTGEVAAN
jgi:hypothetical protein